MDLTDKQKEKLIEEEQYRAQVKAQLHQKKSEKKDIGFLGIVGITFVGFIVLVTVFTFISINPQKQLEEADQKAKEAQEDIQTKSGSLQSYDGKNYTFEVSFSNDNNRYVASFQPFLPNDDKTLIQAILEAMRTTYGGDAMIDPTPQLEERNGVNTIRFRGDIGYYYVLPIKEDTGEIHTLMFWKE